MAHQSIGPQQGTGSNAGHPMGHVNGPAMISHDQMGRHHQSQQYWGQQVYMGPEYSQYGMGGAAMHSQDGVGSQMPMMQGSGGGGHQMGSQFGTGGSSAYGGYPGMSPSVRGPQVITPPRQQGQIMAMRSPMWTQQSPGGMAEHMAGGASYGGGPSGAGLRHMYGGSSAAGGGGYMPSPQHQYSGMNLHQQHLAGFSDPAAGGQKHYGLHAGSTHMASMKAGGAGQMGPGQGSGSSQLVPSQLGSPLRPSQRAPHMSMIGAEGSQVISSGARMPGTAGGQYSFGSSVQGQSSFFNESQQHLQSAGGHTKQLQCQTPLQGHMQLQGQQQQQLQGQAQHLQGGQLQPLASQQLVQSGQQLQGQGQQLQGQAQQMQGQAQQLQGGQTQQLQHIQGQAHQLQGQQAQHQLHSEYPLAGQSQQQYMMQQLSNGQYPCGNGKQGPYSHPQQRPGYPGTPLGPSQMMSPGSKSIHSQGVSGPPASMLSPGGSGQVINPGGLLVGPLGGIGHAVPPAQYRPMSQQQRQQMFAMNQMRQSGLMNSGAGYGGGVGSVMPQQVNVVGGSPYSTAMYPGQTGGGSQLNETMPQNYGGMQPGGKPSTMMDLQDRFGPPQQMSYSQQHELQLHTQQQYMGSPSQQSSVVILQQGSGSAMQPSQMNQVRNNAMQMVRATSCTYFMHCMFVCQ